MITSASNPTPQARPALPRAAQRRRAGAVRRRGRGSRPGRSRPGSSRRAARAGVDVEPELLAAVSELAHPARSSPSFGAMGCQRAPGAWGLRSGTSPIPGNVGTLIRTADAFGAVVALSRAVPIRPRRRPFAARRARSSACRCSRLRGRHRRRVALVADGGKPLSEVELPEPVTFVLGAERAGLPAEVWSSESTRPRRSRGGRRRVAQRRRSPARSRSTSTAARLGSSESASGCRHERPDAPRPARRPDAPRPRRGDAARTGGGASPGAAASTAAAATAAAREAAAGRAGAGRGRSERRAEARREVADAERARPGAEVAVRADPVDASSPRAAPRACGAAPLEHALGDPERDPVDEVALPELERGRRRVAEPREVGEVAAERLPALGLDLDRRRCAAARAGR